MTIHEIAKAYLYGRKLREQARQLSNRSLAKKFERTEKTIGKIVNGMPSRVPEDEQILIRHCAAERDRIKSEYSQYTMPRLCHQYRVSHSTIEDELIRMGEWGDGI